MIKEELREEIPPPTIPESLRNALRTLVDEALGDWVYDIREREGLGWDGPRVKAFGVAVTEIEKHLGVHFR